MISKADQILVIDNGIVAQRGTHEQFLKQDGTYCDFVSICEQVESWNIE